MFLNITQVVQFPPLTKLHGQYTCTSVLPIDTGGFNKMEMPEHGRELLLIVSLVAEVQLFREVGSHFSGEPLEMKFWKHSRDTCYQQLWDGGGCHTVDVSSVLLDSHLLHSCLYTHSS